MVPPGGIIVVNPPFHRDINHPVHRQLVDLRIIAANHREPHGAHPERRQLEVLKLLVDHPVSSFLSSDKIRSHIPFGPRNFQTLLSARLD